LHSKHGALITHLLVYLYPPNLETEQGEKLINEISSLIRYWQIVGRQRICMLGWSSMRDCPCFAWRESPQHWLGEKYCESLGLEGIQEDCWPELGLADQQWLYKLMHRKIKAVLWLHLDWESTTWLVSLITLLGTLNIEQDWTDQQDSVSFEVLCQAAICSYEQLTSWLNIGVRFSGMRPLKAYIGDLDYCTQLHNSS